MMNLKLLLAIAGLSVSICAGLAKEGLNPLALAAKPQQSAVTPASVSSPSPSPSAPAVPPNVATNPQIQQLFLWGYTFDPAVLPCIECQARPEPGIHYQLFDAQGKCIGEILPAGEVKLLHQFPDVCPAVVAGGVG